MRVLVDTCVILDALQSRKPFEKEAQEVFLLAANQRYTGCITAKSATDIYYLTHKLTHSDKETRMILNKLFSLFEVVDTAGEDCRRAIFSPVADFEDAVMTETAKRTVDCVITRNEKDYRAADVKVYSPQAFIELLQAEK